MSAAISFLRATQIIWIESLSSLRLWRKTSRISRFTLLRTTALPIFCRQQNRFLYFFHHCQYVHYRHGIDYRPACLINNLKSIFRFNSVFFFKRKITICFQIMHIHLPALKNRPYERPIYNIMQTISFCLLHVFFLKPDVRPKFSFFL